MKREPTWMVANRRRKGWRTLFGNTTRPKARRRLNGKAKALAAANRRAWFTIAIGLFIGLGLFAPFLLVPPQILPEQVAAAVRAQTGRRSEGDPVAPTNSNKSVERAFNSSNSRAFVVESAAGGTLEPQAQAGYTAVTFEQLSAFRFSVTDQMLDPKTDPLTGARQILGQIPDEVRALDHKEISLRGFMLPMKLDGKLATEFLLLKNQGLCCYGNPPKITEWVNVRVNGKGVRPIMDEPVTVCGTFHVGDVRENGDLLGIYRLDADRFKGPGK
jgi:hypothetical protein